jgi:hypothetical protein
MYNEFLETLDLSSNSIDAEGFAGLCDSLNTNRIRSLKLKNNLLGDEAMKYFSRVIINNESNSCISSFDFSACKIYDQGLVFLLKELQGNNKVTKIKLRDNYFSHEIDYVVVDFMERNYNLLNFDLSRNRLSYQCMISLNKIIERNNRIENEKESNRLLVEIYRLKYENTKLNEMKECLKDFEKDAEDIKLNRAEIRQDYESFKKKLEEEQVDLNRKIEKTNYLISQKDNEISAKKEKIEEIKKLNQENLTIQFQKLTEFRNKKIKMEEENDKLRFTTSNLEGEYNTKIQETLKKIEENRQKELEIAKMSKKVTEQLIALDKVIAEKKKQLV